MSTVIVFLMAPRFPAGYADRPYHQLLSLSRALHDWLMNQQLFSYLLLQFFELICCRMNTMYLNCDGILHAKMDMIPG